eukprot:3500760-Amphidinium_carterae.1
MLSSNLDASAVVLEGKRGTKHRKFRKGCLKADVERIKTSIGKAGKTPLRHAAAALENNAYMTQKLE